MTAQTSINAAASLQAAQTVVANNLANLQTTGYKADNSLFSTIVSGSAAPGKASPSGVQHKVMSNPGQQGLLDNSDNNLDLGIAGEGTFLVYGDIDSSGKAQGFVYSRAGQLDTDKDGFLINSSTGRKLMGYETDAQGAPAGQVGTIQSLVPINIQNLGGLSQPQATNVLSGPVNLPADAVAGNPFSSQALAYDSLGMEHPMTLTWEKTATDRTWTVTVTAAGSTSTPGPITVFFDNTGRLVTPTAPTNLDFAWTNGAANSTISLNLGAAGASSKLTNFATGFASQMEGDGHGVASVTSINIDKDGTVFAQMTSGPDRPIAKLAVAKFASASGLSPVSGNAFQHTNQAGQLTLGLAAQNGMGSIKAGALEKSTVNMTQELMFMMGLGQWAQANNAAIGADKELTNGILEVLRRN